ncbi:hypothetical protein PT277_04610 [Acetobacteraceae bacterium ESL0709]|nr:hypothetical protein [Acetobacteraceae bacterium ESL0697]MDF7677977.1 hypothetical protein [Acetobacteraceae bacterium ESL0709]
MNVCPSGCTYTNPLDAWYATFAVTPVNGAIITIQIADGTYNLANQFYTELPHTKSVHILGNITAPTKVVLNFTHTQGTNLCGFAAYNGGLIGSIDGITIQAPLDGTGSLASTDSRGRHFGAGISFNGAGSSIHLGNHIIVKGFYYSLVADNNAGIDAPNGGMGMPIAGDVNAMARGGGVIVCTPWYSKRR